MRMCKMDSLIIFYHQSTQISEYDQGIISNNSIKRKNNL